MKLLFVGDPHIVDSNLVETQLLIDELIRLVELELPQLIVIGGDTLDRFAIYDGFAFAQADALIRAMASRAPTVLLIGNHDIPNKEDFLSKVHPFLGHKGLEGLWVVDHPCYLEHPSWEGHSFVGCPYVPNGRLAEALALVPPEQLEAASAILCHQEFKGCQLNPGGGISEQGDIPQLGERLYISGHIHGHHWLNFGASRVCYPGTPRAVTFAEHSQLKTVSLFTFSERGALPEEKRVKLSLPEHLLYRIPVEELYEWELPLEACQPHAVVKVVIYGSYARLKGLLSLAKIKGWKRQGVTICPDYLPEEPELADDDPFVLEEEELTQPKSWEDALESLFSENPRYVALFDWVKGLR